MTRNAQSLGLNLDQCVNCLQSVREKLQLNNENYQEAEMIYHMISLVMEINQYLKGGYFASDYMDEHTRIVARYATEIHEGVFDRK